MSIISHLEELVANIPPAITFTCECILIIRSISAYNWKQINISQFKYDLNTKKLDITRGRKAYQ